MASPNGLNKLGWLPLVAAIAVLAVLIALLWVNQPAGGEPSVNPTAQVAPQEQVQAPAAPQVIPEPTPSVVTPAGTTPAPDFLGIVKWLNSQPLSMEEQRGKVILIDFWTYS